MSTLHPHLCTSFSALSGVSQYLSAAFQTQTHARGLFYGIAGPLLFFIPPRGLSFKEDRGCKCSFSLTPAPIFYCRPMAVAYSLLFFRDLMCVVRLARRETGVPSAHHRGMPRQRKRRGRRRRGTAAGGRQGSGRERCDLAACGVSGVLLKGGRLFRAHM